jgi:isocitrate dehydrogenase
MGWGKAAEIVVSALTETISKGIVTYDLARQMKGSKEVTCSQFGEAIINEIDSL